MLPPDWGEKIIVRGSDRIHVKVDHRDIDVVCQELKEDRRSKIERTKKRKLDIQGCADRLEEGNKRLKEMQDTRSQEYRELKSELIKTREQKQILLDVQEMMKKRGRSMASTPVQFIYNYNKQKLSFRFNFHEYSESGHTVPL